MRTVLVGLLFVTAAFAAEKAPTPVQFRPEPNGQINFVMPSRNIGCIFTPQGGTPTYRPFDGGPELSCDRIAPKYVRLVLTPKSLHRFDKVGDQGCCDERNVFNYGTRWSHEPFACVSLETGLTCTRADGRGFSISRTSIKVD